MKRCSFLHYRSNNSSFARQIFMKSVVLKKKYNENPLFCLLVFYSNIHHFTEIFLLV